METSGLFNFCLIFEHTLSDSSYLFRHEFEADSIHLQDPEAGVKDIEHCFPTQYFFLK